MPLPRPSARPLPDLGRAHRLVGMVGVLAFLGTGVYMARNFPQLYDGNAAIRFQFRANHGYLLLASLANWSLGMYLTASAPGWRLALQRMASLMVLAAPAALLVAFFVEPPRGSADRPLTLLGWVLMLAGTVLQALARKRPP
jgi:hypothetical protein